MEKKLEDKIAESKNMKDLSVKTWIINFLVSGTVVLTGHLTNRTDLIGSAYGTFMIVSIGCIAWFKIYSDQEDNLINELEKQNLKERIDTLEDNLKG